MVTRVFNTRCKRALPRTIYRIKRAQVCAYLCLGLAPGWVFLRAYHGAVFKLRNPQNGDEVLLVAPSERGGPSKEENPCLSKRGFIRHDPPSVQRFCRFPETPRPRRGPCSPRRPASPRCRCSARKAHADGKEEPKPSIRNTHTVGARHRPKLAVWLGVCGCGEFHARQSKGALARMLFRPGTNGVCVCASAKRSTLLKKIL